MPSLLGAVLAIRANRVYVQVVGIAVGAYSLVAVFPTLVDARRAETDSRSESKRGYIRREFGDLFGQLVC